MVKPYPLQEVSDFGLKWGAPAGSLENLGHFQFAYSLRDSTSYGRI
jgi:hypothetical protein